VTVTVTAPAASSVRNSLAANASTPGESSSRMRTNVVFGVAAWPPSLSRVKLIRKRSLPSPRSSSRTRMLTVLLVSPGPNETVPETSV
jgi:hypothetical protein